MARRTKDQREHDLVLTADLYLQGVEQVDIAARCNVSQQQVSQDLKEIRKRWLNRSIAAYDQHIAEELAKIDQLERTAWEQFYASVEQAGQITETETSRGEAMIAKAQQRQPLMDRIKQRTIKDAGDPRWLQIIERCIDRRIKLLGLDAPTRIELTDWRNEARQQGLDPEHLLAERVEYFKQALLNNDLSIRD